MARRIATIQVAQNVLCLFPTSAKKEVQIAQKGTPKYNSIIRKIQSDAQKR